MELFRVDRKRIVITGLSAKEAVVSTLAVLMGASDQTQLVPLLSQMFTPAQAFGYQP